MSFFWYQRPENRVWHEALSEYRQQIVSEYRPPFVTVLDCLEAPDLETWGREEFAKLKFTGPCYFDWDAESIEEAIPPLIEFLSKLEDGGVNLKSLRLYATGGRGFHCEIPEAIFNNKPKAGVTLLPYVYKDMAMELATDKMDMRVYTARKGRMWRTPNVKRDNGKYKVSITLDQAQSMTPQLYEVLCSSPCEEVYREPPKFNPWLGTMFDKFKNKVEAMAKVKAKAKGDVELLSRFKGEFPPTVLRLMSGEGVLPGAGFHSLAMQLSITAVALGKSADDLVAACDGLVHSHQSDSPRYNSPRKRKEELRRMFDYNSGESLYEYSKGAIKRLCAAGVSTSDLDSPMDSMAGMVQDENTVMPEGLQEDIDSAQASLLEGVILLKQGIFRRTSEGAQMLSNISFYKPNKMIDTDDDLQVGLEMNIVADNRQLGRHLVPMQVFRSKQSLNDFCTARGAIFRGSDSQASAVQLILSRKSVKDNQTTYIVRKEGLDLVQNPASRDKVERHTLWVCPDAVRGNTDGVVYRYQPKVSSGPVFKCDLHLAKELEPSVESVEWLHALLSINSPVVVGLMVGWFVSCFHKQFYQAAYGQFPLLHPNGTAGSGKTKTTELLGRLFYVTNPVYMVGASQNASSSFSLKSAWTASASIPVIIDEYKPSELGVARYDFLLQHFRLLYNQGAGASGGINRGGAESSFRDVTQYTYSAPTVYLGESQEMQTAIVQRTVAVAFSQAESSLHTSSFNLATSEAFIGFMPQLGALLMGKSLQETVKSRIAAFTPIRDALRGSMDKSTHDRQVYNLAVVLCGLDFLGGVLADVFGDEFDDQIMGIRQALIDHRDDINTFAMAEGAKVLNDMAMISRTELPDSEFAIREGYEYVVGDGYLEVLVKEAFVKYFSWCNRKGFKPLYSTSEGFIGSVGKSPAAVDLRCFDSKLRGNSMSKVFRFSLEKLTQEGVEVFKSKSLG
jgi:hypothetical protein